MKVLLFARARDLLDADVVEVAPAATLGEVRRQLVQQYPHAAGLLEKSVFAINDEFADDTAAIPADAEIALLPPVSGG